MEMARATNRRLDRSRSDSSSIRSFSSISAPEITCADVRVATSDHGNHNDEDERDMDDVSTPCLDSGAASLHAQDAKLPRNTLRSVHLDSVTDGEGGQTRNATNVTMQWWERRRHWANQHWIYEIVACIISAASLTGVIALLIVYDGKPTPEWPRIITINSAIAVLTTLMKGTMVFTVSEGLSQIKWSEFMQPRLLSDLNAFDSASRGPWGATLLLFRRQPDVVAVLGATIIILTLTVDPFAQQVIAYRSCNTNDTSALSTLQKVQVFDMTNDIYQAGSAFRNTQYGNSLEQAILTNFINFDAAIQPLLQSTCATGNCTFWGTEGHYTTLAISHECEDISHQVRNTTTLFDTGYSQWNHSLPSSNMFNRQLALNYDVALSVIGEQTEREDVDFFRLSALLYTSIDNNELMSPTTRPIFRYALAVECRFRPVVKIFNARLKNGIMEEVEVTRERLLVIQPFDRTDLQISAMKKFSSSDSHPTSIYTTMIELPSTSAEPSSALFSVEIPEVVTPAFTTMDRPLSPSDAPITGISETLTISTGMPPGATVLSIPADTVSLGVTESATRLVPATGSAQIRKRYYPNREYFYKSERLMHNGEAIRCASSPQRNANNTITHTSLSNQTEFYDRRCLFSIGNGGIALLVDTLTSLFAHKGAEVKTVSARDIDPPAEIERTPDNIHIVPLLNNGAASMDSINRYAQRIADTMSNYIRVTANMSIPSNEPVKGTTVVVKTCASVTWVWLLSPALLTLSTIGFLTATIWRTRAERGKEGWPGILKSTPLGLLLYGPMDDVSFDRYSGPDDAVAMECAADGIRTRLRRRDAVL